MTNDSIKLLVSVLSRDRGWQTTVNLKEFDEITTDILRVFRHRATGVSIVYLSHAEDGVEDLQVEAAPGNNSPVPLIQQMAPQLSDAALAKLTGAG